MNITLTGVKIQQDIKHLAFRKNNLVDVMNITVDTDESWEYKIDVEYPVNRSTGEKLYNVIDLIRNGDVCTVIMTADMLPFNGKYTMQLRGISGNKVYHTDTFEVWVKYSIDIGDVYNSVPSEFYQIEDNITEMNNHPPMPSDDGYWMIWDVKSRAYIKSDIPIKITGTGLPAIDDTTKGKYLTNDGTDAKWADIEVGAKDAVLYIEQSLTDVQKSQARMNIGAGISSFSGNYDDLENKPNIPTKISDLTNDSEFVDKTELTITLGGYLPTNAGVDKAEVGQILSVKSVDSNGKPSSWSVVDKPKDGEKGDTGPVNVLKIGTVESGTEASATITGQSPNQVLNLVLPKGDKGDTGSQGEKGTTGATPDIQIGEVITLDAGSDATASITGTVDSPLLNLGIPKGADGAGMDIIGATAGQIAKITAVDAAGKPTAWEAVDLPSGGGEKWEKIAEIVIPEGAEETNALTINKDLNGNPFRLVKARLCAKYPKYTGESSIPTSAFAMINGGSYGASAPLAYTSAWALPSKTVFAGMVYEVDVSGAQQIEEVSRSSGGGLSDDYGKTFSTYTATSSSFARYIADAVIAKPITSIGGLNLLIFPGCKFVLFGVRE